MQSRYYDPELGRFINADAYASTGQGILGNNMFAYCLNNSVIFSDHSGMISGYSYIAFSEELPKFDGNRSTYLPPEEKEYIMDVVSAKKILSSEDGGYYKGVWIHKSDLLPSGSGVSYVMVAIASDVNDYQTVMHEYGHFLHLSDVGLFTYTGAIAVPSFIFAKLSTMGIYQGDYHSLPWEYI